MIQKLEKAQDPSAGKESTHEFSEAETSATRSWPVVAAGVAAAAGVGLFAASLIGVGEVAIAGAAGYLAYRRMTEGKAEKPEAERTVEPKGRKRLRSV